MRLKGEALRLVRVLDANEEIERIEKEKDYLIDQLEDAKRARDWQAKRYLEDRIEAIEVMLEGLEDGSFVPPVPEHDPASAWNESAVDSNKFEMQRRMDRDMAAKKREARKHGGKARPWIFS